MKEPSLTEIMNAKIDSISDQTAQVAARFTQALKSGWSPNKIMEVVQTLAPDSKAWAKRILDICIEESKNWP